MEVGSTPRCVEPDLPISIEILDGAWIWMLVVEDPHFIGHATSRAVHSYLWAWTCAMTASKLNDAGL